MEQTQDVRRGPGRPRKEKSPTADVKAAASMLVEAIENLPPIEAQSINVTLNGNHDITVADALRMAKALINSLD